MKYKGFGLHTEFYNRSLSSIDADGPIPLSSVNDKGYSIQVIYMIVPSVLAVYGVHTRLIDEFDRNPWEAGGGINIYPVKSRSWRINVQGMYVYKSAAGGVFGLYTAGQTGPTFTIGTDILI